MMLKLLCLVFCAFLASPLYGTSPYQPNDRDVFATIDEFRNIWISCTQKNGTSVSRLTDSTPCYVMCQRHGYRATPDPPKWCQLCGTCKNGTCKISPDCLL
ncbi:uncharacterized protein [Dermacentor andersoni]|uniref:uncharacterized protein n=1 Tax=Dermacentor andersoni TaxID=34620 RepID=UPI003B3B8562